MRKPEISVLMPVYNAGKYLREAIESILNQTFKKYEFLIFDDGSTDTSVDIIQSYRDKRITLIRNKKNLGIAKNLNKGIALAKGGYIVRMDSDDFSLPTRLEEQFKFMEANKNIAVCGSWVKFFGGPGDRSPKKTLKDSSHPEEIRCWFLFNCVLKHPSVIIRKEVLQREGYLYNEKFDRAEDYELWVRISRKYDLSNLEKVLLKYRIHEDSVSLIHRQKNIEQANRIREIQLLELGLKPSKEELDLHNTLARRHPKDFPFQRLDQGNQWLLSIYHANKKSKRCDDRILFKVISQKWRDICKSIFGPQWIKFNDNNLNIENFEKLKASDKFKEIIKGLTP